MKLTAKLVPHSSVVGTSVSLQNEEGAVVAILAVMVPNPQFDYYETAKPIAETVIAAFNAGKAAPRSRG